MKWTINNYNLNSNIKWNFSRAKCEFLVYIFNTGIPFIVGMQFINSGQIWWLCLLIPHFFLTLVAEMDDTVTIKV